MKNMILLLFVICLNGLSYGSPDDQNFGHERVVDNILQNYGQKMIYVRPSQNTTAGIGVHLAAIKSFNQATGRLTAHYWMKQTWKDSRLEWEDSSVDSIRIPISNIWKPDFRLFNSVDWEEQISDTLPLVMRDGTVLWIPNTEFVTACTKSDDEELWTCKVAIGTWTYNNFEVNTQFFQDENVIDIRHYTPELNGYEVKTKPGTIDVSEYDCCPGIPYAKAEFYFTLRKIEGGVADAAVHLGMSFVTMLLGLVLSRI